MLSNKVKVFCKNKGWWYEEYTEEYANALKRINIDLNSEIAQFFLHVEDTATFYSRNKEIYQVCWFIINSNYDLDLERTHNGLGLPGKYIPLDSFEGEGGFFYDKETKAVIELELGRKFENFKNNIIDTKWDSFNEFLEWYFELVP